MPRFPFSAVINGKTVEVDQDDAGRILVDRSPPKQWRRRKSRDLGDWIRHRRLDDEMLAAVERDTEREK